MHIIVDGSVPYWYSDLTLPLVLTVSYTTFYDFTGEIFILLYSFSREAVIIVATLDKPSAAANNYIVVATYSMSGFPQVCHTYSSHVLYGFHSIHSLST